jgi:hypothetical protein
VQPILSILFPLTITSPGAFSASIPFSQNLSNTAAMPQYVPLPSRNASYKSYDDQDGSSIRCTSSSEDDLFLEKSQVLQIKQHFYRRHYRSILAHMLLTTFNLILCLGVWQWSKQDCPYGVYGPELTYSKATLFNLALDIRR